jgi:hypothetical protein
VEEALSQVVPYVLALALVVHAGAHVALAVALAKVEGVLRGALALVIPPLAPLWGWRRGMRRRVYVWAGALALYALGVAVA